MLDLRETLRTDRAHFIVSKYFSTVLLEHERTGRVNVILISVLLLNG